MNIVMYWRRLETRDWDHTFMFYNVYQGSKLRLILSHRLLPDQPWSSQTTERCALLFWSDISFGTTHPESLRCTGNRSWSNYLVKLWLAPWTNNTPQIVCKNIEASYCMCVRVRGAACRHFVACVLLQVGGGALCVVRIFSGWACSYWPSAAAVERHTVCGHTHTHTLCDPHDLLSPELPCEHVVVAALVQTWTYKYNKVQITSLCLPILVWPLQNIFMTSTELQYSRLGKLLHSTASNRILFCIQLVSDCVLMLPPKVA